MRATRLGDFARGIKCRIVSAAAPLPLIMRNVEVCGSRGRADVGIGPYNEQRKPPPDFVGGDAHIAPPFDRNTPLGGVGGGVPDAPR